MSERRDDELDLNKDYYFILGLEAWDTTNIRKKYIELSREYHPDINDGNDAVFKLITEAYRVLKEPELKSIYDRKSIFGAIYEEANEVHDYGHSDKNIVNSTIKKQYDKFKKDEFIHITLSYNKQDYINSNRVINYTKRLICEKCDGSGTESILNIPLYFKDRENGTITTLFDDGMDKVCDLCEGSGKLGNRTCTSCGGSGELDTGISACSNCKGTGYDIVESSFKSNIDDFKNDSATYVGRGNQHKIDRNRGDLYINLV